MTIKELKEKIENDSLLIMPYTEQLNQLNEDLDVEVILQSDILDYSFQRGLQIVYLKYKETLKGKNDYMELNKAGHVLYDNIDKIEWKHLPKPVIVYYDEIMRYYYLGDGLYLFKQLSDYYFMATGNSPWNALKNQFKWDYKTYNRLRNYSLTK